MTASLPWPLVRALAAAIGIRVRRPRVSWGVVEAIARWYVLTDGFGGRAAPLDVAPARGGWDEPSWLLLRATVARWLADAPDVVTAARYLVAAEDAAQRAAVLRRQAMREGRRRSPEAAHQERIAEATLRRATEIRRSRRYARQADAVAVRIAESARADREIAGWIRTIA